MSWLPDILVDHNGDILWIPPAIYVSSCTIYVEYFVSELMRTRGIIYYYYYRSAAALLQRSLSLFCQILLTAF